MKATVNNTPVIRACKDTVHVANALECEAIAKEELKNVFIDILTAISLAETVEQLKSNINLLKNIGSFNIYFKAGFCGSHLWVKQIDRFGECFGNNIITVNY